jgi:hypothetical protein
LLCSGIEPAASNTLTTGIAADIFKGVLVRRFPGEICRRSLPAAGGRKKQASLPDRSTRIEALGSRSLRFAVKRGGRKPEKFGEVAEDFVCR